VVGTIRPWEDVLHAIGWFNPPYSFSGLLVGLLVGLTGVGGGSLMTPILVLFFGIQANTAVGTDLLYAATTKSVGTAVHGTRRTVDWPIVGYLALGSAPAATLTIIALSLAHAHTGAANKLLTEVLGGALILTAIAMLFRTLLIKRFATSGGALSIGRRRLFTVILGAILGVLVSLTSVGAGAIGLTVLLILYPSLPAGRLVGSDIAHAVPLTLIAGAGHWLIGDVNVRLLAPLLVGSIPGIIVGSLISSKVSDRVLRPIMGATLALVGFRLIFS